MPLAEHKNGARGVFGHQSEDFALVSAERDKFTVEIPVSRFCLPQQSTLGMLAVSEQPARPDIVGKDGKQKNSSI